mmetsp:Transcript_28722/g.45034  ORF Transcript_28722/g.45034 Transcript_28722/m.45034 type:complete len:149 (-) Transcript_28722:1442-1888(-)|eukprot:CAMPEP_0184306740 /NCGR_PEP_ID=MMETSP1049-20130417/15658_1 /TAXON_ID=77928 /ORGANISM="Proteomonas sulcata, Strain CCMP704" /LENGTH=148 /DNA_ID=CAMNT_0026619069 /DNA_START=190 /DNA_END=636 /DNA_ORIENTATION=+
MASELPADMDSRLTALEEAMTKLEQELEPALNTNWDTLTGDLEALDKAKLNLMIAYAADSLFFLYLKTQGQDPTQHPISEEVERVKSYLVKLKDAVSPAEREQARLRLNKEAAARFIMAGTGQGGKRSEPEESPEPSPEGKKKKKKQS